jgi:DNA-binding HxlR family transcriptional regulator
MLAKRTDSVRSVAQKREANVGARADRTFAHAGSRGFVFRNYEPTIPLAVTYRITDRMKDIEKVWVQLENLSRKCRPEESTARGSTAHSAKAN